MGRNPCFSFFLLFTIIFQVAAGDHHPVIGSQREALEIVIGDGGDTPALPHEYEDCAPPPPPPELCTPPPPPPCLPPNIERDYNATQKFKEAIKTDPKGVTKSWNRADRNVCNFEGFTCAERPDTGVLSVAAANFNGYNLGGPNFQLKDFLDQLLDLSIFHANSNNFAGILPNEIGTQNLNFLFELDLSNNKYTGGFPISVLSATNLTFLDIRYNSFSGPVPGEVFNLDLDVLLLNNNQFSQQLPDNIGSTPALYLTFANNYFTGPIPSSIGSAKYLREVLFLNNNFTGCLPYEIGFLNESTLLDVSRNNLTGPIPHSFACLAKIQILNLASNEFYGPVPEMVCKLPYLQNLSLSGNYFTQVGPVCRKLIELKTLDVSNNCILDLPNQKSAKMCKEFFSEREKCPNEKSLTIVPCMENYRSTMTMFDQKPTFVAATPPISYDALSPRNSFRF
ncbi:uncharacterized protein At4g06744 [Manihot esculenta]|uniref:Cell wall hydroxyproline-rich glycoprotein n=1 Tax=Manihot esculenta TaxID=3983 RepID=A0A2C9VJE8_MANES|nr:uncharacterized protein At4g06744 [Manihot esculenta]OAY45615.1 hypothetical protein MANES_07G076500v8 [Manihot esculenta]